MIRKIGLEFEFELEPIVCILSFNNALICLILFPPHCSLTCTNTIVHHVNHFSTLESLVQYEGYIAHFIIIIIIK